jgi:hypothetical protein
LPNPNATAEPERLSRPSRVVTENVKKKKEREKEKDGRRMALTRTSSEGLNA